MDLNVLKTQIMTMFMMRQGQNKEGADIFHLLYSMMFMNIVEQIFKHLPAVGLFLAAWMSSFRQIKATQGLLTDVMKREKQEINSISMTRVFSTKEGGKNEKTDNSFVEKVDAVLDYICSIDNARHIRLDTRYSLNTMDEITLTPLLKAKVKQVGGATDEERSIELMMYSTSLKVSEIRRWIDEIHENYVAEKNNKLGNKIYYFNEVAAEPTMQQELMPDGTPRKTYRWENMPKMLTFNMNEFKTSKSFANVYGHHVDELKERLDLFVNHPDWYMDRGIPHSLGIMLHGVPGAGKTSTIKAIAKDTHRHIFNLSLRPYTTQRQLTNLFFNETIVVNGYDGLKQVYKIPLNRRVYVIEDIDCLTDVVLERDGPRNSTFEVKEGESITLSFLLNLLDGVLETPGRILVITSNFPEKLDRAFVRPGRIDVKIEFSNADRSFILDMLNRFYSTDFTLEDIPIELDSVFTPAEVMESLCMYFKNPRNALLHLKNKIANKQRMEREHRFGTALEDLLVENTTMPTLEVVGAAVSFPSSEGKEGPSLEIDETKSESPKEPQKEESHTEVVEEKKSDIVHTSRTFEMNGMKWSCSTCKIIPKITCAVCNKYVVESQKRTNAEALALSAGGFAGFGGDQEYASAMFGDAQFLDTNAMMPGQNPLATRSAVDLNAGSLL